MLSLSKTLVLSMWPAALIAGASCLSACHHHDRDDMARRDRVEIVDEHGYRHQGTRDEQGYWHGGWYDEHREYHKDPEDWRHDEWRH